MKYLAIICLFIGFTATAQYAEPCKEVPALNKAVVEAVKPYLGKQLDRGECWDAAKLALNAVGAEWDGLYNYGRKIDVKTECIQPGDIVQFEGVKIEVREGNSGYYEVFEHHTAIVYAVKGPGDVELIHQNTGQFGRKMGVSGLKLSTVKKGEITFYRPVKKT
jgi:hypothetical protein